jgi:hypothetical protein
MPELLADERFVHDSRTTYERSVALEELWTWNRPGPISIPGLSQPLDPELVNFLRIPQSGARAVAKATLDRVLKVRAGQFVGVSTAGPGIMHDGGHDELGRVFPDLPADTGHWGVPYFEHVLGPLRHAPPDYVREIQSGEFDVNRMSSRLSGTAGVVVVQES